MIIRNGYVSDPREEEEYFNPARKHLKKPHKKQVNTLLGPLLHANTELQHRFRDTSS
jgi:hypothetical protein